MLAACALGDRRALSQGQKRTLSQGFGEPVSSLRCLPKAAAYQLGVLSRGWIGNATFPSTAPCEPANFSWNCSRAAEQSALTSRVRGETSWASASSAGTASKRCDHSFNKSVTANLCFTYSQTIMSANSIAFSVVHPSLLHRAIQLGTRFSM